MTKLVALTSILVFSIGVFMADPNVCNSSEPIVVDGTYLAAWNVCYKEFIQIEDLTEDEKELKHYSIEFSEDRDSYIIYLIPNLLSDNQIKKMNRIAIGRETKYWVDKATLRIRKRSFFK